MNSDLIIREARRRARLTQGELAERAGTTQSAIARWETGRTHPSWEKLQELVQCCGLELSVSLVERREGEERALERRLALTVEERMRYLQAAIPMMRDEDGSDATGFAGDDAPLDPVALLSVLAGHQVRFVVVGGLAATLHGSPFLTDDVDIAPARERENAARLSAALSELCARPLGVNAERFAAEHLAPERLQSVAFARFGTKYGRLDILWEPSGTAGFDDLRVHAAAVEIGGAPLLLASLPDVIRSKEAAGRTDDRVAVPTLRRLLRLASAILRQPRVERGHAEQPRTPPDTHA